MEVKEENVFNNLLCHSCLSLGRYLYNITNEKLLKYYLDALDEIPLTKSKQLVNITVCWECKAILQKSWSFREQAKDCYRILLAYTNENLKEYLFSDISRPPHLQVAHIESIDILPKNNEAQIETLNVHVKEESSSGQVDFKDDVKAERQSPATSVDCLSDNIDSGAEDEEIKVNDNECLSSDVPGPPHLETQQIESINVIPADNQNLLLTIHLKDEPTGTNSFEDIKDQLKEYKCGSNLLRDVPDTRLSDTIHMDVEELRRNLEPVICSDKRNDKERRRNVKGKSRKNKKVTKRIGEKKKVVTIELSYEEMLLEREKDSKRDAYAKAEFKCETCLIGFNYKKTYQTHLKTKHSPTLGEYICPICKTIISSVDSFTAHYKRHLRRYECVICHKRTSDLKVMEQHYYSNHEISLKKYTCNICGKISNSVDTHRYHKESHKARLQCSQCDKSFRHRAGLMNHRLAVHESHNAFPCSVCDKVFRWKTSLKRHLQKHEAKNKSTMSADPFCAVCNISFASVSSYHRHLRNSLKHVTHDQLKFICDHCNRKFSDKTKLRDHIEEKHLHRTFHCHICSKPSKNRVGLDQHIRNVHMDRPKNKMCHYCGRGFPTKIQLESHIRTHTGERPYICEYCPTTFSQQSNLYKHNRQVHLNIKTKRYPLCKKKKEDDTEQTIKVPVLDSQAVIEEPYRPIVLQYSPEREFVL